jgi:hypothetical protein
MPDSLTISFRCFNMEAFSSWSALYIYAVRRCSEEGTFYVNNVCYNGYIS